MPTGKGNGDSSLSICGSHFQIRIHFSHFTCLQIISDYFIKFQIFTKNGFVKYYQRKFVLIFFKSLFIGFCNYC